MSTHLIFPSPPLQGSASETLFSTLKTRLGRPTITLNPTLSSTSPLGTGFPDPSAVSKSGGAVTGIGQTPTVTASATARLMDGPTSGTSSTVFMTSEQNPANGRQGSSESHLALIISSIAFALAVTLIIMLITWFIISRRQGQRGPKDETGELMGYLDKERGIPYERSDAGSMNEGDGTREGSEDSQRDTDAFNSLNMVVDRSIITSMALSHFTGSSNPPPPPYGNGIIDSGNERVDAVQTDFPPQPTPRTGSIYGGQPPAWNNRRTIPGAEASFAALAKLLPPTMIVQYTFTPASPDEMEVKRGDKMQITGVFDDGWCLCRAESGRVGVVPLACLDIPESTFTSFSPGYWVRNIVSDEGVPGQKEGRKMFSERTLPSVREEEKGRLVTSSPRLSSRRVVIVQNESRGSK